MNRHPVDGARLILQSDEDLDLAAVVAYEHHIMLNGGGYPALHYGRPCALASRLVHVCDVYDALRTKRPYRDAWRVREGLAYLDGTRRHRIRSRPGRRPSFACCARARRRSACSARSRRVSRSWRAEARLGAVGRELFHELDAQHREVGRALGGFGGRCLDLARHLDAGADKRRDDAVDASKPEPVAGDGSSGRRRAGARRDSLLALRAGQEIPGVAGRVRVECRAAPSARARIR